MYDASDDAHASYYKVCALRTYFMFLVDTSISTDKSVTYINVVYIKYFMELERINKYNWEASSLAYLYSKLNEGIV